MILGSFPWIFHHSRKFTKFIELVLFIMKCGHLERQAFINEHCIVKCISIMNLVLALSLSSEIIQPASFTFAGLVACQERAELVRLEKDFEHRVTKRVSI